MNPPTEPIPVTVAPAAPAAAPPHPAATRSVRVLRNVVSNYVRLFVVGVVGFVITPALLHGLGKRDYGLWVMIFSLTGYFGLFDQGIRPSLVRYLSRDQALGDHEGMHRTVSSALYMYSGVGLAVLALTLVAAVVFPVVFRVEPAQVETGRTVLFLAGASLAAGFPLGVYGAALSGLQRYDLANVIIIGVAVLRGALWVLLVRMGGGLVSLAWVSLAMNLLGGGLSWLWVRKLMPPRPARPVTVTRQQLKMLGSYSGIAFIGAVADRIAFQTDALVIAAFIGTAPIAFFSLAAGLVENARSLVQAASFVLAPSASELEARGESRTLHALVIAGARYSVLLVWPVLLAFLLFGQELFTTWLGRVEPDAARLLDIHNATRLLDILTVPTMISLPLATAGAVLYGVSRHRGVVALATLNAVLNLVLSILWVKPYGAVGVAMGTAVPLALVSGVAMAVLTVRTLALPPGRYLMEGWVKPAAACLVFVVPAVFVERAFHPVGWVPLGAAIVACWLPFLAVAWWAVVPPNDRRRWGRMLRGLMGRPAAPAGTPPPGESRVEDPTCA